MDEFKVGDRVLCVEKMSFADIGELGTIVEISDDEQELTINWDRNVGGWIDDQLGIEMGHGEFTHPTSVIK